MSDSSPFAERKSKRPKPRYVDIDGNEIHLFEKWIAGALMILLTTLCCFFILAYWPDRLPTPRETVKPLYFDEPFHVRLADIPDTARIRYYPNDTTAVAEKSGDIAKTTNKVKADSSDSTKKARKDSTGKGADTTTTAATTKRTNIYPPENKLIHINTILLILVAAGGFLGNMIYIATSFTTYVGAGKYRKSWTMWYCVKPFTAAGLALTIYFVFRGGFLNMSDNSTNINIYGVMTISLLAGLFTDRTTLKLKEVFDVLLKPKEERPDSLDDIEPKITDAKPNTIEKGKPTTISMQGRNLTKKPLTIKIEGVAVSKADIKPDSITFSYTLPEALKSKTELQLLVSDDKGKEVFTEKLKVAEDGSKP